MAIAIWVRVGLLAKAAESFGARPEISAHCQRSAPVRKRAPTLSGSRFRTEGLFREQRHEESRSGALGL